FTINEAAAYTGLSVITVKRGLSISHGNRTSFGRACMPGLRSKVVVIYVNGQPRMRCFIKRAALDRWVNARAKFGGSGKPRGRLAKSLPTLARKKKGVLPGPSEQLLKSRTNWNGNEDA